MENPSVRASRSRCGGIPSPPDISKSSFALAKDLTGAASVSGSSSADETAASASTFSPGSSSVSASTLASSSVSASRSFRGEARPSAVDVPLSSGAPSVPGAPSSCAGFDAGGIAAVSPPASSPSPSPGRLAASYATSVCERSDRPGATNATAGTLMHAATKSASAHLKVLDNAASSDEGGIYVGVMYGSHRIAIPREHGLKLRDQCRRMDRRPACRP